MHVSGLGCSLIRKREATKHDAPARHYVRGPSDGRGCSPVARSQPKAGLPGEPELVRGGSNLDGKVPWNLTGFRFRRGHDARCSRALLDRLSGEPGGHDHDRDRAVAN